MKNIGSRRTNSELKKRCDDMKRESFTLIELLIVMVIIGILIGLLFPVLGQARQRARVAQARDMVAQIALAWQCYLVDYRMFPSQLDNDGVPDPTKPVALTEMNYDAVEILAGRSANYNTLGSKEYL